MSFMESKIDHGDIRLDQLLSNLTQMLSALAAYAAELDDDVGNWIEKPDNAQLPASVLQRIDYLRQVLECTDRLMENLTSEPIPEHLVSALKLSDGVFLEYVRTTCLRSEERPPP